MLRLRSVAIVAILVLAFSGIAMGASNYSPGVDNNHTTNFWDAGVAPEGSLPPNGSEGYEDSVVWMFNRFDDGGKWGGFGEILYKDTGKRINAPDDYQLRYWFKDSARSVNSGFAAHDCDARERMFKISNNAEIAQWMVFNMTAVRKDWQIAKPGIYASKVGTFTITSNDNVAIKLESSGYLYGVNTDGSENKNVWIEAKYAWGDPDDQQPPALSAFNKNLGADLLDYTEISTALAKADMQAIGADGLTITPVYGKTLWSLLVIEDGTTDGVAATKAGNYSGYAKITVAMKGYYANFVTNTGSWK